jgi:peptidoglycan/xylan/chitin deacetylase (PgdA/CDA1 family)
MSTQSPFIPSEDRAGRRVASRRRRQVVRRRVIALAVLGLILLAGSILIESGGSSGHRHGVAPPASAPSARLKQLAELAQRRAAAESRAVDRVLAYTPFVTSGGGRKREVALTFDDGPGPYTPEILRVLRRFDVKATFFEVGFMERWFHASTAKAVHEGHVVGDHTEQHPKLASMPRPAQRDQIVSQAEWLSKLKLPRPRLFRPPYGSFNGTTFSLLRKERMLVVLWSVDTDDYRQPGTATIIRRALHGAKPGAIILMHDAGGARSQTAAALPTIIRRLRRRHYRFVTVPRLMLDDPPPRGQRVPRYLAGG